MKLQSLLLSLIIVLLCACTEKAPIIAQNLSEAVTIYRDAYGTPQVVADSNAGVYFWLWLRCGN